MSTLAYSEQEKLPLETAYKMQLLQGLGLMLLSKRKTSLWLLRLPAAACFYVSSTLLPATLIYRYFGAHYVIGYDYSLQLSKIGGLSAIAAWVFLSAC